MRIRIWPFVSGSFCMLLLLVPLFGWMVSRKAAGVEVKAKQARSLYHQADQAITDIRMEVYRAALLFRQPPGTAARGEASRQLARMRSRTDSELRDLETLLAKAQHPQLTELREQLKVFWNVAAEALQPPGADEGAQRLLIQRTGERDSVLGLAEQIDALNTANLRVAEQEIDAQQHSVWQFAALAAAILLVLGMVIAGLSIAYLAHIEGLSETERRRAEEAEDELRRLSNQLVRAQEEERKTISRELHDEVGQILTGLRMELGGLWRGEADVSFSERLNSVKALAEDALRSVRTLSLLLRPSMLDDLGLAPALRWQAKEFSRRTGIEASTDVRGNFADLPEASRICLYRSIQEALTNCAKHSNATKVTVRVEREIDTVAAYVNDNGKGFHPGSPRTEGLGLVGMDERVRSPTGRLSIPSAPHAGTTIAIQLPLPADRSPAAGTVAAEANVQSTALRV
ncbi:MAG: sensor histidine kinase [Acidobacteriaceae bacterium]|nr:sensor histidine kinase [Acidobacteriaceae bacterium]